MNDRKRQQRLRDKRFAKMQVRKRYRQYFLANFHERQAFFDATFGRNRTEYVDRKAPKTFSLLTNRDRTIAYFNRIHDMLCDGIRTHMDLSDIDYADMPTISTLSAYMLDPNTPSANLQVSIPKSTRPQRKIWDETQFENMILRGKELNFGTGGFLSRSDNRINNDLIEDILNSTVNYFGSHRMSQLRDLSAVINEIAENTILHADSEGVVGNLKWLINSRDVTKNGLKVREYCLVDLGVGVYDSIMLNVTRWNTKSHKIKHRLANIIEEGQSENAFLSKQIPKGIGSKTNQSTRGKGVRHVYDVAQTSIYDVFDIITNKAHIHLKDTQIINKDSPQSFFGTVYYWRISFND